MSTLPTKDQLQSDLRSEIERLRAINSDLVVALKEGRRAIGDHLSPDHCYATGPLTGNAIRDLVQCPACSFISMYDAAFAKDTS